MERDGFVFYRSFRLGIDSLDDEIQLELYRAITDYGLDGKTPQTSGVVKAIFELIKPQIDKNNQRYDNSKKGGRPKTKGITTKNQTETKAKPNENQSKTKAKPKTVDLYDEIIENYPISDALNQVLYDWCAYKDEIKKPIGAKSIEKLIKQSIELEQKHGFSKVKACFDDSIKNGWQGVFFDKIGNGKTQDSREEIIKRFVSKGVNNEEGGNSERFSCFQ